MSIDLTTGFPSSSVLPKAEFPLKRQAVVAPSAPESSCVDDSSSSSDESDSDIEFLLSQPVVSRIKRRKLDFCVKPNISRTPPTKRVAAPPPPPTTPQSLKNYKRLDEEEASGQVLRNVNLQLNARTKLRPHQLQFLNWAYKKEARRPSRGILLADDMGMGKTIQTIALCVSNPPPSRGWSGGNTLVVMPKSLLLQWQSELRRHLYDECAAGGIHLFYGSRREKSMARLARYRFVLTTYEQMRGLSRVPPPERVQARRVARGEALWRPPVQAPLEDTRWWRVVLDEGHRIRNRGTCVSKAARRLRAAHRLVLSGTPIQNSLDDLFSILRFLRYPGAGCGEAVDRTAYSEWKRSVGTPLARKMGPESACAARLLHRVLTDTCTRRLKGDVGANGRPLVPLPPVQRRDQFAPFDGAEQAVYDALWQKSRARFNRFLRRGTVFRNFHHILLMILRLRQACAHPSLCLLHNVACGDCGDPGGAQLPVLTLPGCGHSLCLQCADQRLALAMGGAATCACVVAPAEEEGEDEAGGGSAEGEGSSTALPPTPVTAGHAHPKISAAYATGVRGAQNPLAVVASLAPASAAPKPAVVTIVTTGAASATTPVAAAAAGAVLTDTKPSGLAAGPASAAKDETPSSPAANQPPGVKQSPTAAVKQSPTAAVKQPPTAAVAKQSPTAAIKQPPTAAVKQSPTTAIKQSPTAAVKQSPAAVVKQFTPAPAQLEAAEQLPCTATFTRDDLIRASRKERRKTKRHVTAFPGEFPISTKIAVLLRGLAALPRGSKALVYSQWTSMLAIVESFLDREGLPFVRLDGQMSMTQRAESVRRFSDDAAIRVFSLSICAGGVGLNLTAATHVFLMDPWWNPAVERQAFDRCHRIGQTRAVTIHRLYIQHSIERSLLDLQEKKQALADAVLDSNPAALAQKLNLEDLRYIFRC